MPFFGRLWFLGYIYDPFCAHGDAKSLPKWVKDEVSGLKICKFEFSTIKDGRTNTAQNIDPLQKIGGPKCPIAQ